MSGVPPCGDGANPSSKLVDLLSNAGEFIVFGRAPQHFDGRMLGVGDLAVEQSLDRALR